MAIKPLAWETTISQAIRIYRNLNNGTMSIQTRQGKSWKVAGHVTAAIVRDVHFHIQEGGRQRVIREQCKNVHAWAQGILIAQFDDSIEAPIDLCYNPYRDTTFVERDTLRPLSDCQYLVVRDNRVFVSRDALPQEQAPTNLIQLPSIPRFVLPAPTGQKYQAIAA